MLTVLVAWAAQPPRAAARGTAPPAITEEERALEEARSGEQEFPLGANISLTQAIGGGTFVQDPFVRRTSYDLSLSLAPYWRITPLMRLTASVSLSHSLVENYDSTVTYRNRTLLSDTTLSLAHLRLYTIPVVKVGINGSLSVSFPSSPQSQFRTLYASTRGSLGFSKILGPVYLRYGVSAFKNFNRYDTPAVDTSRVGEHVVLAHYAGREQLTTDLIAVGGNNTEFGVVNTFLVSWNVTDEIALAVYYALNNSWTYRSFPDDELTAENAQAGRGQRDAQTGVVDITYQFTPELYVSAGTQTVVAPKTADNDDFIFPFMNFSNNHRNNSAVYLSLGGVF